MSCNHPKSQLRLRTLSNGATAIHQQCLTCGEPTSPAIKKASLTDEQFDCLPPFDNALRERYREEQSRLSREEARKSQEKWDQGSPERKREYDEYLKSPEWRSRRNLVMKRDGGLCQGCLSAPATLVHHKKYAHRGDEVLFDLVALCDACHRKIHGITQ